MGVSYDVTLKSGEVKTYTNTVCYAPYYNIPLRTNVAIWHVYVPEKGDSWQNGSSHSRPKFDEDEVLQYLRYFSEMGFNFSYQKVVREDKGMFAEPASHNCLKVNIPLAENSQCAALILLNALRYLHESNMQYIPRLFLQWMKAGLDDAGDDMNPWSLFCMAHYGGRPNNNGHSIFQHYHALTAITMGEFKDLVLDSKDTLLTTSPTVKGLKWTGVNDDKLDKLREMIQDRPLAECFAFYHSLTNPPKKETPSNTSNETASALPA